MITLYHNPRCSKSRRALQLLTEAGETIEVVKYLETNPSRLQLLQIIEMLNIAPIDLVRKKETLWKENFEEKDLSDEDVVEAMVKFPILIERPIAINGTQAVIGRPALKVLEIL